MLRQWHDLLHWLVRCPHIRTGILGTVPAVADGLPQGKLIAPLAAQTAALVARLAEVKAAERQIDPICAPHPRSAAGPVAMQCGSRTSSSS
jgi:hypothetical protein